jgi:hypothetical protein
MRKILAMACAVAVTGSALPAYAQALQVVNIGPDRPPLKCGDFKHNPDGSWSPVREISILFPDGTTLTTAPSVTFPAGESWMGLPMAALLNEQCVK